MYKKLNSDTSNAEADQKPNLDSDFINHHFPSTLKMVYKSIQDKHSKRTSVNSMPIQLWKRTMMNPVLKNHQMIEEVTRDSIPYNQIDKLKEYK